MRNKNILPVSNSEDKNINRKKPDCPPPYSSCKSWISRGGRSAEARGRPFRSLSRALILLAVAFSVFTGNTWSQATVTCPHNSSATQKDALLKLYCATDGDNWNDKSGWSTSGTLNSSWHGVTVPYQTDRVTSLTLNANNLRGTIPTELGSLTNLTELWLQYNKLTGTIPAELGSLTELADLYLNNNQLSGAIPSELGGLTKLKLLWFNKNQLSGAIPSELGGLTKLTHLYFHGNELSGTIPTELGSLTKLQLLRFGTNDLSGTVPTELGGLTKLTQLDLQKNDLSGSIPTELGNLTDLRYLYLGTNNLSGTIPAELGSLTNLLELPLQVNQLSGTIPAELGNLRRLVLLVLSTNQLSGSIPTELGNLTNLQLLAIHKNQLGGTIPAELGNLTNLQHLLYLHENQLSGAIPAELGSLTKLQDLTLHKNELSGTIPAELGSLTKLKELYLGTNNLSGIIPTELGDLASLKVLLFQSNQMLHGPLPLVLTDLQRLTTLNIEDTKACAPLDDAFQRWLGTITFTGNNCPSPEELDELTKLYQATGGDNWKDSTNWLSHEPLLSRWFGVTTDGDGRVTALDLSDNGLRGELPLSLMNLGHLTTLNIEDTQACAPLDAAFQRWLGTITFTGSNCPPLLLLFPPPKEDFDALWEFYWATGGGRWADDTNWLNYGPLSLWHGVATDGDGRVTALELSDNKLSGELPESLQNLSRLTTLDLSDDPLLGGELPLGLMDLPYLTTLNIESTQACAPADEAFQRWLRTIDFRGDVCDATEEEVPERPEEEVSETGGGCAIASDGYKGNTPGSVVLNLLAVVCAMFFAASLKKR